jgi:hypothetical protein
MTMLIWFLYEVIYDMYKDNTNFQEKALGVTSDINVNFHQAYVIKT